MPLREAVWMGPTLGWDMRTGPKRTDSPGSPFEDGVTVPFYIHQQDLLGAKNVGNKANTAFGYIPTTYTGSIVNGVAQLQDGQTYENVLFPCVVDLRNSEQLVNCRIVVPANYTTLDTTAACVRVLNGSGNNHPSMVDCEIHNRAQRPMNGVSGRNLTVNRTVVTGCVDGFSTSNAGSAPQGFGFNVSNSIVVESAWWYTPSVNTEIHSSDTQSHGDGVQHGFAALVTTFFNTVICEYVSEIIGTGTPGCGKDAGNSYVPDPTRGYNYIATQAQMEAWRATYCSTFSEASQTMGGVARRLPTTGGSLAAAMLNRDGISFDKCYFDGGLATINMQDTNLPTNMNISITNCVFWNGMRNGHSGGNPVNKGYAVTVKTGKTLVAFTNNKWFDGTTVSITYV